MAEEKHPMDRFRELMGEIHALMESSEFDLTYAEGVYIAGALRHEAELVDDWIRDGAVRDVLADYGRRLDEQIETNRGLIDMYDMRDEIEERGWSPEQELEEQ